MINKLDSLDMMLKRKHLDWGCTFLVLKDTEKWHCILTRSTVLYCFSIFKRVFSGRIWLEKM